METAEFIQKVREILTFETTENGIAGVQPIEEGDLGLTVDMQDGSEFYLAVTKDA